MKQTCKQSLPACVAAASVQLMIDKDVGKAASHITGCDLSAVRHSVADAAEAYRWLQTHAQGASATQEFFKKAQSIHRWSAVLDGQDRLPLSEEGLADRLKVLNVGDKSSADASVSYEGQSTVCNAEDGADTDVAKATTAVQ
jgi:hypothetical protein